MNFKTNLIIKVVGVCSAVLSVLKRVALPWKNTQKDTLTVKLCPGIEDGTASGSNSEREIIFQRDEMRSVMNGRQCLHSRHIAGTHQMLDE